MPDTVSSILADIRIMETSISRRIIQTFNGLPDTPDNAARKEACHTHARYLMDALFRMRKEIEAAEIEALRTAAAK